MGSTLVHVPDVTGGALVNSPAERLRELAALGTRRQYDLAEDPERADIILFPQCHMLGSDWRMNAIRDHPLTTRFASKVIVYDERDRPWCSRPGVYVSMPARKFDRGVQRVWGYYGVPEFQHPIDTVPDLLFSLVAEPHTPVPSPAVRTTGGRRFCHRGSPRFHVLRCFLKRVRSASGAFSAHALSIALCALPPRPRNIVDTPYEALSAGRVPVIISDDWVPPDGPDWSSISIRWPEGRASGLVDTIRSHDREWEAMSRAAFGAYEAFFAPWEAFERISGLCEELLPAAATFHPASPWNSAAIAEAVAQRTSAGAVPIRRLLRRALDQLAKGLSRR